MLREEYRLRIFENKVLRIFGLKKDEVTREWKEDYITKSFMFTPQEISFG
jgi:hypothetical protein